MSEQGHQIPEAFRFSLQEARAKKITFSPDEAQIIAERVRESRQFARDLRNEERAMSQLGEDTEDAQIQKEAVVADKRAQRAEYNSSSRELCESAVKNFSEEFKQMLFALEEFEGRYGNELPEQDRKSKDVRKILEDFLSTEGLPLSDRLLIMVDIKGRIIPNIFFSISQKSLENGTWGSPEQKKMDMYVNLGNIASYYITGRNYFPNSGAFNTLVALETAEKLAVGSEK